MVGNGQRRRMRRGAFGSFTSPIQEDMSNRELKTQNYLSVRCSRDIVFTSGDPRPRCSPPPTFNLIEGLPSNRMRLSTVFELLLIFLFIAFAASRSVDKRHHHHKHVSKGRQQAEVTKPASAAPNRYCQCTSVMCNCCRDFSLPVVSLKGPGCANVEYITGDSMRLTMSFGDRILRNITLNGKKPRPVCMGLPGAETKFCGRIYGIQRVNDQFRACLALEMRSLDEIEAALRVSCFKFGPNGVKLEPGRPIPDTDDYDDDDDYGLDDEDDDEDDDDDFLADDEDDDDEENDVDSGDYTGFSALGDEFLDGFFGSGSTKKKKKVVSTTLATPVKATKKPIATPGGTTAKTDTKISSTTAMPNTQEASTPGRASNESTTMGNVEETASAGPVITSTEFSVKVMQGGSTIDETSIHVSNEAASNVPSHKIVDGVSTPGSTTNKVSTFMQNTKKTSNKKGEEEVTEEEEEEEEEEEQEEGKEEEEEEEGSGGEVIQNPKEKVKGIPQSKDDDENILDGILGDDDDEDDEQAENDNDDKKQEGDEDDDDDDDEDEFRQLRSHVPRSPYKPMTLEDQERQFPGLSALIKPPSIPFLSLQEQERRFPGLAALIRPQQQPAQAEMAFDFPPVRSARTHRRMRLPAI